MRELERRVVLATIDRHWRDHLYENGISNEGIGLRAMAQRDPLVEYQREGYELFLTMMDQIKEESLGMIHNLEVQVQPNGADSAGATAPVLSGGGLDNTPQVDESQLSYTAPTEDGSAKTVKAFYVGVPDSAQKLARRTQLKTKESI